MSTVQNNKTVGHPQGCARITFWGQDITTAANGIGLYSFIVGLAQEGISYDDENILGRAVETENVFNCRGALATKQGGNQTVNEKTFSIAYNDDYNFVVNDINPLISKSTMSAIFKGTKFKVGSQEIVVLGMQGFRWLGTTTFETLSALFYAGERDGQLISADKLDADGNPELVDNGVKTPYEKSALLMVEFLYAFNASLVKGDRFIYCLPKMSTFTEGSGTSPNAHSVDFERFSDARSIKEYLVDGSGVDTVPASGSVYEVTADEFFYVSAPGTPTTTPADGTVACVVDSDDGTACEIWVRTGGSWVESTTAVFEQGCKIICKSFYTALDGSAPADGTEDDYSIVIVKTAGVSGAFAVYGHVLTADVDTTPFYFPIYDWNYSSTAFTRYQGD